MRSIGSESQDFASDLLAGRQILVTGGSGSLGTAFVERALSGAHGPPERVVVFSRDEAKQHDLRIRWARLGAATDDAIWSDSLRRVKFHVGDVRDVDSLSNAMDGIDTVIHAAALKQVPTCEYFPEQAYRTNVVGADNLVSAVRRNRASLKTVVGVSTDKAVKPVNVMGMSKSLQERILSKANLDLPDCRFVLVRYGNVVASRGSVIPLFAEQAASGGPLTITDSAMTRFLLSLADAVDAILRSLIHARRGETLVPLIPSARIIDLARAVAGNDDIDIRVTGVRPGEKLHEILVSEEERHRTVQRGEDLFISSILPELREGAPDGIEPHFPVEYSSEDSPVGVAELRRMLGRAGLLEAADKVDHQSR